MKVPFFKAQGAGNDFVYTWEAELPPLGEEELSTLAMAICHRHKGIGADGWYVMKPGDEECDAALRLFNSDGSRAELSGNGTRCAALVAAACGTASEVLRLRTGAGVKAVRMLRMESGAGWLEMGMGSPVLRPGGLRYRLALRGGEREVTLLDVGNPQCAVLVESFEFAWQDLGAEIEGHTDFPNRTNVSFVKPIDRHSIEARFYERGAGATLSSGTGATGAAAAAVLLGLAEPPVEVRTQAECLQVRWSGEEALLAGPAEIVGKGEFFWQRRRA